SRPLRTPLVDVGAAGWACFWIAIRQMPHRGSCLLSFSAMLLFACLDLACVASSGDPVLVQNLPRTKHNPLGCTTSNQVHRPEVLSTALENHRRASDARVDPSHPRSM